MDFYNVFVAEHSLGLIYYISDPVSLALVVPNIQAAQPDNQAGHRTGLKAFSADRLYKAAITDCSEPI